MLSVGKPASLVQQKKEQWAREREMSQLYLPWGSGERYTNRLQVRNQFASTLELHKQSSYEYQEPIQRQRSPSLPPIRSTDPERSRDDKRSNTLNRNIPSAKRFSFYDEDAEGDTSGYGSETINHMNRNQNDTVHNVTNTPVVAWQHGKENRLLTETRNLSSSGGRSADGTWSARSPRSSTAEEGRPRWGDRGVATGRLWEPTAPNARLPQMKNEKKGTPSWVERGLNMIENTAEVLVIDQTSSTNSGFECDRSSCNGSDEGKTFLRGQNVPLEPEIKAQRENKRIKALELQSAILSQLEDREKRRQEERERCIREERLEELRMQRQQEEDRLRLEEEKRKLEEKQLMEQKKLETLKKALEDAEKKARLEKEKKFSSHRQHVNAVLPCEKISKEEDNAESGINSSVFRNESISPTKTNRTYDLHSAKSKKKDCESQQSTGFNSPRSVGPGNLNLFIHSVPPLALADNQFNIVPIGVNGNGDILSGQPNSIQLAVLVPQNLTNSLYSVSLNSLNNIQELTDTGKILTPRKYRSGKTKDASTQTDVIPCISTMDKIVETELERNIDKNYPNIDENAPQESHHNTLKKDRRFRSEERYKKEIENRPKWGVNRPAAQYKKQSEKDPFYSQKRKIRQKYRPQVRQYLSQSSEDSRSPSPPLRQAEKISESGHKHRNSLSQSYWKNKRSSQDLSRSVLITETDQNTSEFNNLNQIVNDIGDNKKSPKMSPNKRMTLSQKFINDKYGNRKLWIDDINERNNKSNNNIFDVENRKRVIDQLNVAKRDYLERHEDQENLIFKTKY
ncbi:myb-like protein X isoform X2 [Achroia grisella]|uniref:myb-like protein X isoform X2 n=1 Tax=Achroia grisella TaxID=688607 RepID=UPI0027D2A97A|nr:myb-like protein X isoform X2 [Achroia grisella]